jgi:UDP-N-acetylglucosamine:LPS N-acetylglucosamine transferase
MPSSGTAPRPQRDYHVVQIAGRRDYRRPAAADAAGEVERYTLLEYEPTLADLLAACDRARSGGGSVFELAAAGRAGDLVPTRTRRRATKTPTRPGCRRRARRGDR